MRSRDAWVFAGISVAMLLLLIFFLYQSTIFYLTGKWNQLEAGEYGHGYLVLLISAYLIFYNRQKLMALTPRPEYRAVWMLIVAGIFWVVSALVDIEALKAVCLLMMLLSMVWVLLGNQVINILAFPILFIIFAIPVWFSLSPLLQGLTADVVFWVTRLIEIPALRIENMIVLPAGKLSIEEACSGLRYFLAALTLGVLYAYLNYATFPARLMVVLVCAGAAVLANILRVFIVVYLGYTTDMQHSLVNDHLALGWYLFAGLVAILLSTDALIHRLRNYNPATLQSVAEIKQTPGNNNKSLIFATGLIVLCISVGPFIVDLISTQAVSNSKIEQIKLPFAMTEWSVIETEEDGWRLQYRGANTYKRAYQYKNNQTIYLLLGLYQSQKQGEELINDQNKISDDKIWRAKYQSAKLIKVNGQRVLEQLLEKSDGTQRLVWYWYHVAGQDSVNKYQAKALQVLGFLNGMRQASIVAIATRLDKGPEQTRKVLSQFVSEVGPSLIRAIDDNE